MEEKPKIIAQPPSQLVAQTHLVHDLFVLPTNQM